MSTKALEQVAALSRAPIVASHSAPRALVDIKRNLSDHEMQLIKDSGGVIQVVGFPAYLRPLSKPTLDKLNALRARFDLPPLEGLDYALMPGDPIITIWPEQRFGEYASALYGILEEEPKAGLKELVDAIDYTVKKVGIDHVGISSDFNDGGGVDGWKDVSEIPQRHCRTDHPRLFRCRHRQALGRQLPARLGRSAKTRQADSYP